MIDAKLIGKIEGAYFRTQHDTGANPCAMLVWNAVRFEAGLPPLSLNDLPGYCLTHKCYHKIAPDYGCKCKPSPDN